MTSVELEPELRAIVPACRLVPDRILRRILHELIDLGRPVIVNTRLPWWVTRADLATVEDLDETVTAGDQDPLLFLVEPDNRIDITGTDREVRATYYRFLLHAEVFRRVPARIMLGTVTPQSVEPLFQQAHWEYEPDIRYVLASDHMIPDGAIWSDFFPRFVAVAWVWLETEPEAFCQIFPSAPSAAAARAALEGVLDTSGLPAVSPVKSAVRRVADPTGEQLRVGATVRAERAARRGNHVRAAILWHAGGEGAKAESAVRTGFLKVLAPALKLDPAAAVQWADAVMPLLGPAGQGVWPRAARALYDLQKLGLDLSGELFAVDPGPWVKSFGKVSLKQSLNRAVPLLRYRAVANALRHLELANLPAETVGSLTALLESSRHAAETEARADYVPRVTAALDAVGLSPTNVVEEIARNKLANELVDTACDRGFLRFGNLRDAIARNNLKLPDLRGPKDLFSGDPLLNADKHIAAGLPGVYHGGEAYLRGIQRASSVAFGTSPGRMFSKYVAMPFGGAFLTLEFVQHMVHAGQGAYRFASKVLAPKPREAPEASVEQPAEPEWVWDWQTNDWVPNFDTVEAARVIEVTVTSTPVEHHGPHFVTWPAVIGVGIFLLALFYWPAFRAAIVRGLKFVGRGLRLLFRDFPSAVWQSPAVRAVRRHRLTRWVASRFGSGVVVAGLAAGVLAFFGASPGRIIRGATLWFAFVSLGRMLPTGRKFEDRLVQSVSDAWRVLSVNLIPGLFSWLVWVFRELAAWVERSLYAVDEWFRFREGQSRPSYRLKVALAFVWFPIAYVVRFAFNLLLEPQVNPVKHFPVVTVSHKVLFTSLIPVSQATGIPEATLAVIFTGVPGIFGFLAWELKENWRLYAANRPKGLQPVVLGHHGETMCGLLRPGFHSGTVPKQFRTIRKQLAHSPVDRNPYAVLKAEHELHHIEHAIRRFVEREFLSLLATCPGWEGISPVVHSVHLTNTNVTVCIRGLELDPQKVESTNDDTGLLTLAFYVETHEIYAWINPSCLDARLSEKNSASKRMGVLLQAWRGLIPMGAAKSRQVGIADLPAVTWDDWKEYWDRQSERSN